MTHAGPIHVACIGFVFDPVAQTAIRELVPPGIALTFAESLDDMTETIFARSNVWLVAAAVTDEMMARAPELRFIQKWGTGYDKIDVAAAARRGIPVAITAGANAVAIAEHTIALMLAVMRRIAAADRSIRAGTWSAAALRPHMRGLFGKTVGIVGFGNIGRALARLLRGFEVKVLYFRRSGPDRDDDTLGASYVTLPDLLAHSDIVSLHVPANAENAGMFGRVEFAAMKPGAVFVNAARGSLVVEADLVEALTSGHLLGAGLDVFAQEPLSKDSPLLTLDNVVMTPHSAGGIMDGIAPLAHHSFGNILRVFRGEPLDPADVIVPQGAVPTYPQAKSTG